MSFRYFCLRLFEILLFGLFNSSYVGGAAIDECAELSWQSVCVSVCVSCHWFYGLVYLCVNLCLAAVYSMMNGLEKSKHNRNAYA